MRKHIAKKTNGPFKHSVCGKECRDAWEVRQREPGCRECNRIVLERSRATDSSRNAAALREEVAALRREVAAVAALRREVAQLKALLQTMEDTEGLSMDDSTPGGDDQQAPSPWQKMPGPTSLESDRTSACTV